MLLQVCHIDSFFLAALRSEQILTARLLAVMYYGPHNRVLAYFIDKLFNVSCLS